MYPRSLLVGALAAGVMHGAPLGAQSLLLDSLVARAIAVSPLLRAAFARVDAARARVRPASALPDPMLMLGIINQPLGSMAPVTTPSGAMPVSEGPDPMTMRMVGVSQAFPYPGKRSLLGLTAEREVNASLASRDATRRQVIHDVKVAWYEIAFIDRALEIVERNRAVLADLITLGESRYSVGMAGQQEILKTRVEASRLAESAAGLMEQRVAASARLNVLLDQPPEMPVPRLVMPEAIARAAVASSPVTIRFSSSAFGARAADSPLLPVDALQDAAGRHNPDLREQDAMIAAQQARVALAQKAHLPDVGVTLQYGQRSGGLPDMVSATVSIPIPIFKGRKQDDQVVDASAGLAAMQFDRQAKANAIRADVARLVSEIERERTGLALLVKAILPQSRAALTSATASYQVGKGDLRGALENQSTVFNAETEYFRALSDFAIKVAELERMVGQEVLQ